MDEKILYYDTRYVPPMQHLRPKLATLAKKSDRNLWSCGPVCTSSGCSDLA